MHRHATQTPPEGTSWVYKSARVKSEMTLAEGWSRTHPSPFKGGWGGGGGYYRKDLFNTYNRRKSSPLSPRYLTTLQDLSAFLGTSVWLYVPACPLAVPGQIYRSTYQRFTWIYPPTTGGALPWNDILPGTTNAADNNQTCVSIFSTYSSKMMKKKYTYIKTIGNKLSCSRFFFCAGGD